MDFLTCNSETRLRSRCNKCLICVTAFSFLSSQLGGAAAVEEITAAELFWPCFWPLSMGKYLSFRNSRIRGRSFKKWRSISDEDKNDYNYILIYYMQKYC